VGWVSQALADRTSLSAQKGKVMQIKLTSVFVDDQEKALKFYTDLLGFVKKMDFSAGSYRWLTVVSPEEPEGVQLVLERNEGKRFSSMGYPPRISLLGTCKKSTRG
jgi:hypothetical protein